MRPEDQLVREVDTLRIFQKQFSLITKWLCQVSVCVLHTLSTNPAQPRELCLSVTLQTEPIEEQWVRDGKPVLVSCSLITSSCFTSGHPGFLFSLSGRFSLWTDHDSFSPLQFFFPESSPWGLAGITFSKLQTLYLLFHLIFLLGPCYCLPLSLRMKARLR